MWQTKSPAHDTLAELETKIIGRTDHGHYLANMQRQKMYFNWSSGKDSALALYQLLRDQQFDIQYLLTSVNAHHNRVSMHGVRRKLLQKQIESIGIESGTLEMPEQPTNDVYERLLSEKLHELRERGFQYAGFGDIFLEDLRNYREHQLHTIGIKCVFPLWKRDTKELMNEFLKLGFKAVTVCVNGALLDESFVGKIVDSEFLSRLPEGIDVCGENGEFHTFCFDGPIFSHPIKFSVGDVIQREYREDETSHRFLFCDLIP